MTKEFLSLFSCSPSKWIGEEARYFARLRYAPLPHICTIPAVGSENKRKRCARESYTTSFCIEIYLDGLRVGRANGCLPLYAAICQELC
jgi:hypothetical protein